MMLDAIMVVCVIVATTFLMRVLPFVIFGSKRKAPDFLLYLGKVLPGAIVGMLIVYCFKDVAVSTSPYGLNELLAFLCVAILQILFKMPIVSIVSGTLLYMYLLQSSILNLIL
ncbi:AzlD domain-containing protein [Helicobacter sp. 11S02596-1]|uniref:branched-chain amino acid transporter permease n=1 Tax=Helicobacter sp. 11S02596-1 TaxID=1476194 RepID=UPI000BA7C021|nr:AzlD domain-containing protein [Helicobacter sp. 11S02596-1]PAF45096.1 branched-chain amino acid transporter AzlD [Helicobacter sp. 11S02596-1]